jgi:hypothetical protein
LLLSGREYATWLPERWELGTYPAGYTWPHVEAWFAFAEAVLNGVQRSGGGEWPSGNELGAPALSPRGLIIHAHLLLRHPRLANALTNIPPEPHGPLTLEQCHAELLKVRDFLRAAIGPPPPDEFPPLDGTHLRILEWCLRHHPAVQTHRNLENGGCGARSTIGPAIEYLITHGLLARLLGDNKGVGITPRGRAALAKLPPDFRAKHQPR